MSQPAFIENDCELLSNQLPVASVDVMPKVVLSNKRLRLHRVICVVQDGLLGVTRQMWVLLHPKDLGENRAFALLLFAAGHFVVSLKMERSKHTTLTQTGCAQNPRSLLTIPMPSQFLHNGLLFEIHNNLPFNIAMMDKLSEKRRRERSGLLVDERMEHKLPIVWSIVQLVVEYEHQFLIHPVPIIAGIQGDCALLRCGGMFALQLGELRCRLAQ
mmetsp:Transcript_8345/g.30835  ORF Transcript_8345/g.30835 Transcript_8345/m.30835 type:complete len:215 (+) Transcript_8345:682-1326(+)